MYERFLGRKFTINTGQRSLKFLLEQRVIQPQYQKWIAKLLGYSFEVVYKPGLENQVADALSRMPLVVHLCNLTTPTLIDLKVIKEEVEKDDRLKVIMKEAADGEDGKAGNYSIQRGMLRYEDRLIISKSSILIPTILHTCHDSVFGEHSRFLRTYK